MLKSSQDFFERNCGIKSTSQKSVHRYRKYVFVKPIHSSPHSEYIISKIHIGTHPLPGHVIQRLETSHSDTSKLMNLHHISKIKQQRINLEPITHHKTYYL